MRNDYMYLNSICMSTTIWSDSLLIMNKEKFN